MYRTAQVTIANKLCTSYVAKYTGDRGGRDASIRPDVALFSKNNDPGPVEGSNTETLFLHMQLPTVLKRDTQYDPFCDLPDGGMEGRDSINGNRTRRKCLLHAQSQLAYQHLLFAFSLVICGKRARFIRWDREGVIVSAGIDCSQHPELVIEFLRRFDQLTDGQRGLDPTATPATPEQVDIFESAVAQIDIESLKLSVGDRENHPRFMLEVRESNNASSYYIVGRALDYDLGLIDRCTRGYLALDLSTKECVFLKDTWRPDVSGVEPEHVWYEKLIEAGVPHLVEFKHASDVVQSTPPCYYHGTLTFNHPTIRSVQGAQRGLTHHLARACDPPDSSLQGRIHYRLVQRELCRPLSEFTNSKHLALVMLHSLEGLKSQTRILIASLMWDPAIVAYFWSFSDVGVFHGDVSPSNIMIGLDGKGKLNGWGRCQDVGAEGPLTVRILSHIMAPVFTSLRRGPGSSCHSGYCRSWILPQGARLPMTSSHTSTS